MRQIQRYILATCSVFLLTVTTAVAQSEKPDPLPIEDIVVFSKVFETIKNSYV